MKTVNNNVVIFGTGQIAEIVYQYFTHDSPYTVSAFTVDSKHKDKDSFYGLPVIEFENIEKKFPPDKFQMFIALSYTGLNQLRAQKYYEAKQKKYNLVSYISSKAGIIADFETGDNCLILENQLIQPYAKIGSNVFVWAEFY